LGLRGREEREGGRERKRERERDREREREREREAEIDPDMTYCVYCVLYIAPSQMMSFFFHFRDSIKHQLPDQPWMGAKPPPHHKHP